MRTLGELLRTTREQKRLSQEEIASKLLLKKEFIEALEEGRWESLPEPAYVRGFIRSYADMLGLDDKHLLALYRAEYDEKKYPTKKILPTKRKRFMFTPEKILPGLFAMLAIAFIAYLLIQYTSFLSTPKLEITSPQDDITTTASVIEVAGKTQTEATVSIEGEIIPVDPEGKFSTQIKLEEGRNTIEIVASRRLSPKAKVTRIVRLAR
ncbi:MAG: helix-turn-helix domain-containing protein [Candidatus Curtissbacteria bacterium]|nr:helix-turn-helix domain-containing protein [Candidatus Curtissbacteria bacterium]